MVNKVFPYGTVKVSHPQKGTFKVNGQRLKLYFGGELEKKVSGEEFTLSIES